ncbi:MAG: hypothetical protein H6625_10490 [Bdellovibrionaceae bacterium]|nr:hypothetical protein [Pseudobdellovibrionaceae bacterium]
MYDILKINLQIVMVFCFSLSAFGSVGLTKNDTHSVRFAQGLYLDNYEGLLLVSVDKQNVLKKI